jgi:hypothetical protein
MADQCFALVRGRVIRVTRLDGCGNVLLGPDSKVVSEGVISVALTSNTDAGTAISVTNAAGKVCILDTPTPKFVNYTVEVAFCGVDPQLVSLMTNNDLVLDANDDAVGFDVGTDVDLDNSGFALEMWSNVPAQQCAAGQTEYGYFLLPFLQGGVLGDFTWQNTEINFTMTGAATKDGNSWGVGPYDVQRDDAGVPGPLLVSLPPKKHLRMFKTSVAPPEPSCGATAVGVPATTATAGSPATLAPGNSYAPASFATIGALTASPLTAWTSGQYLQLRDGSTAHWDSTQWVAGVAP